MKKKKFSWMPKSPALRALMQGPVGILAINWVFQGMRGMQRKELSFRLLLEAVLAIAVYVLLPAERHGLLNLLCALVVAHSFNWLLNTHLWVCVRYFPLYRRNPAALAAFLVATERQLQALPWLDEAVFIGSVGDSGGIRSERSDIDLRLIFAAGTISWLRVNLLLLRLRTKALITVIPLDLYAYDDVPALDRFRQDEGMRILVDRHGRIKARYGDRIHCAQRDCDKQTEAN